MTAWSGSLTVEAALVLSFILLILGGLMLQAVELMKKVEGAALILSRAPNRYSTGIRPEDLIHVASFIKEWIPPK